MHPASFRWKHPLVIFLACCFLLSTYLVPLWSVDQAETQLNTYFQKVIGLVPAEITDIQNGNAVVKMIHTDSKSEVDVFGAIYINAPVEKFLALYGDVTQLRGTTGILAINKFSDPPQISDLAGFTLSPEDIKNLASCKLGDCEVQLPAAGIDALRQKVNWSAPDATDQVNELFHRGIVDGLKQYQTGGNSALGTYRDKEKPFLVSQHFQILLGSSNGLPIYLPEFHDYLLNYPKATLNNSKTYFYWETVQFGLKPTSRVNQMVVYSDPVSGTFALGDKQLYATHYFETAIDLTFCVKDPAQPSTPGFYLITRKGSTQEGLTGIKGSIIRKVAEDRTSSSLKQGLTLVKQKLEGTSN